MTSLTLRARLLQLNVASSYSRPRVSDDNAFIEPLFRTLKHGAVEPDSENRFRHEYRVKSLPLLYAFELVALRGLCGNARVQRKPRAFGDLSAA